MTRKLTDEQIDDCLDALGLSSEITRDREIARLALRAFVLAFKSLRRDDSEKELEILNSAMTTARSWFKTADRLRTIPEESRSDETIEALTPIATKEQEISELEGLLVEVEKFEHIGLLNTWYSQVRESIGKISNQKHRNMIYDAIRRKGIELQK